MTAHFYYVSGKGWRIRRRKVAPRQVIRLDEKPLELELLQVALLIREGLIHLKDLGKRLGLPKSTVFNRVASLRARGYLTTTAPRRHALALTAQGRERLKDYPAGRLNGQPAVFEIRLIDNPSDQEES